MDVLLYTLVACAPESETQLHAVDIGHNLVVAARPIGAG